MTPAEKDEKDKDAVGPLKILLATLIASAPAQLLQERSYPFLLRIPGVCALVFFLAAAV